MSKAARSVAVTVTPLTRQTGSGEFLQRPASIEHEIANAVALPAGQLRARASAKPGDEESMSSECIVHLIRQDLRDGSRRLADELTPLLLERCEASLHGSVRGFTSAAARDIREDVLDRLALSLLGPGDEADFLEVRFGLALKRLRIDACRRQRRRDQRQILLDDYCAGEGDPDSTIPAIDRLQSDRARQEDRLMIKQALASLAAPERDVLVLHRLAGIPLRSKVKAHPDLVSLLKCSERTLRNRLRRAERRLQMLQESPE